MSLRSFSLFLKCVSWIKRVISIILSQMERSQLRQGYRLIQMIGIFFCLMRILKVSLAVHEVKISKAVTSLLLII
jgi:hypothetical protein